jgi:hypothetical protein
MIDESMERGLCLSFIVDRHPARKSKNNQAEQSDLLRSLLAPRSRFKCGSKVRGYNQSFRLTDTRPNLCPWHLPSGRPKCRSLCGRVAILSLIDSAIQLENTGTIPRITCWNKFRKNTRYPPRTEVEWFLPYLCDRYLRFDLGARTCKLSLWAWK